jgi:hypothetical protein
MAQKHRENNLLGSLGQPITVALKLLLLLEWLEHHRFITLLNPFSLAAHSHQLGHVSSREALANRSVKLGNHLRPKWDA